MNLDNTPYRRRPQCSCIHVKTSLHSTILTEAVVVTEESLRLDWIHMEWLVTSTTGYFLWYHILDQTTDRKKELCDENAYGKLGTPEKELDRQLWFGVCCRRACKYCAVVNFAEPVTQIQKVSQSWMAALDVRDKLLMERAYFYIQVFHFWNVTKQNLCLPGGECHSPSTDCHATINVHSQLHTLQLTTVSLSLDILVGEPPQTVWKLQHGKHIVTWKLRFHINLSPFFLFNTAGCIFNSVYFLSFLFHRNSKWTARGWMDYPAPNLKYIQASF